MKYGFHKEEIMNLFQDYETYRNYQETVRAACAFCFGNGEDCERCRLNQTLESLNDHWENLIVESLMLDDFDYDRYIRE